ncbi:MAG: DUF192 domain-containing protein [Candidatus Aenigmarchaeota archaeon]|nr:DUF192 domain-containing protein [Candidatus Aenigmarchaeota archaeon]
MKICIGKKTFCVKDCRGISCIRGLMFDGMRGIDGALVRGSSIWMPFVKRELDLFFLDKNLTIIKKEPAVPMTFDMKTWRTYSCRGAKYCLEMKKGVCKTNIGGKISIINGPGRN